MIAADSHSFDAGLKGREGFPLAGLRFEGRRFLAGMDGRKIMISEEYKTNMKQSKLEGARHYASRKRKVLRVKVRGAFKAFEDSQVMALWNLYHPVSDIAASLGRLESDVERRLGQLRKEGWAVRR